MRRIHWVPLALGMLILGSTPAAAQVIDEVEFADGVPEGWELACYQYTPGLVFFDPPESCRLVEREEGPRLDGQASCGARPFNGVTAALVRRYDLPAGEYEATIEAAVTGTGSLAFEGNVAVTAIFDGQRGAATSCRVSRRDGCSLPMAMAVGCAAHAGGEVEIGVAARAGDCMRARVDPASLVLTDVTSQLVSEFPDDLQVACDGSIDPADIGAASGTSRCGEWAGTYTDEFEPGCPATIVRSWVVDAGFERHEDEHTIQLIDEVAPVIIDQGRTCVAAADGEICIGVGDAVADCDALARLTGVDCRISDDGGPAGALDGICRHDDAGRQLCYDASLPDGVDLRVISVAGTAQDTCGLVGNGPLIEVVVERDAVDIDQDGLLSACDPDDDDDGVADAEDNCPAVRNAEQRDRDADGVGDVCADADADGLTDAVELLSGTDPDNPDTDEDGLRDGVEDANANGVRDAGETDPRLADSDEDTVPDGADGAPLDRSVCRDFDGDGCDDCAVASPPDPANDGPDSDGDGRCDASDDDDDDDTVLDAEDGEPLDPRRCRDVDADGCDDCAVTSPPDPANDGPDTDGDGRCDASDDDDDDDTVPDAEDGEPLDPRQCRDDDGDGCDDCAVASPPDPANDGPDLDGDGRCDAGDDDDDGDTVPDAEDADPLDPRRCRDADADGCDDCAVVNPPDPADDGPDRDADGVCDVSDPPPVDAGLPDAAPADAAPVEDAGPPDAEPVDAETADDGAFPLADAASEDTVTGDGCDCRAGRPDGPGSGAIGWLMVVALGLRRRRTPTRTARPG